jgi:hypothetical protein
MGIVGCGGLPVRLCGGCREGLDSSGNLGAMHPVNFYANFVPIQETSE